LDVVTTYGLELRLVPTATQDVSTGQTTEVSCDPDGIELVVSQSEKSVVVREVAPPPEATPTATQVVPMEHDNESRKLTAGRSSVVHVPPLAVPTIAGLPSTSPTAAQVMAFEQETESRASVSEGGVWAFQVEPSTVSTILIPSTAVHSSIVKHEMD
jgi:hypothetical protein